MGPISSLAGPVHIVGHLDDPTLQFSRAQNRALVGDVSLGNEGLFKHAIVTSQLGWAYEMKKAGAAIATCGIRSLIQISTCAHAERQPSLSGSRARSLMALLPADEKPEL